VYTCVSAFVGVSFVKEKRYVLQDDLAKLTEKWRAVGRQCGKVFLISMDRLFSGILGTQYVNHVRETMRDLRLPLPLE
jgi:hypothetical protein